MICFALWDLKPGTDVPSVTLARLLSSGLDSSWHVFLGERNCLFKKHEKNSGTSVCYLGFRVGWVTHSPIWSEIVLSTFTGHSTTAAAQGLHTGSTIHHHLSPR